MKANHHHLYAPGPDPAAPTLLLLHGTGGNENDLVPLAHSLAPQASLLSVRGNVLEHGMPRFFRRLAEGVFDQPDLLAHELADFLAEARIHYELGDRPVVALGFSNGANIAASMLLLRPEGLAGAILLRATVPFELEVSPGLLTGKPVLLAEGQSDPYVSVPQARRLAELLQNAGAAVTTHWSPGGHQLAPGDLQAAREWLQNFRKGTI